MYNKEIRKQRQQETLDDIYKLLKTKKKCIVLRPTGCGKTWIATKLVKYYGYKRIAYIYPAEIIRKSVEDNYDNIKVSDVVDDTYVDPETIVLSDKIEKLSNCDMITYAKLALMKDEDIDEFLSKKYDLIIFDEAHRMCAKKARITIEKILTRYKKNYVGFTATPIRSDGLDVVAEFFNNVMARSYSIGDAINDGLLKKPYYIYCDCDVNFKKEVKNKIMESALRVDKENMTLTEMQREVLKGRIMENLTFDQRELSDIIGENCKKYLKTSYMKFIIFFRDIKHMDNKINTVKSWFKKSFPNHKIRITRISSKNKEESKNVGDRLADLKVTNNTIDLIGAVDMMNLGYHVDDISGIIMCRGTHSNIIYCQQFGRILSVNSKHKTIVFDIVDNVHRKAVFDLRPSDCKRKYGYHLTDFKLNENKEVVIIDDGGEEILTRYYMNRDGKIVDENGDPTDYIYKEEDGCIYEVPPLRKSNRTDGCITDECIDIVGKEATSRQIMAKLEAELLSQKCHWVLETHLRSWCIYYNLPYPVSKDEWGIFYDKKYKEFLEYFADLIRKHKLDYPYYDIEKLLYIGTGEDDIRTSIEICASIKNISVAKVLDILGFK